MSKIITKNQLDLVIESTLKEADYMMEAKDELKLTKQHMDELHKEGHCMCDDTCLVYTEDIKGDDKKMSDLLQKLASEKMDCVIISKDQMDMLHKDGKCDCNDNVTLSYEDEMKEGDYMEDGMNENKEMCSECGTGMMVEGMCNECGYSMNMDEAGVDEDKKPDFPDIDNDGDTDEPITKAAEDMDAAEESVEEEKVTEITVGDTTYKVVEESVSKLTEALLETTNKEVVKEDIENFNKLINYRK